MLLASGVVLLSFLILAAPYAFLLAGGSDREWVRLANIGQTYGAVSALLSGLALVGVVASLRIQANQRLSDRLFAKQQRHHDMMRYVFDEPEYSQCWGPRFAPDDVDERLYFYTNIILGEWQAAYELGDLSQADVRLYAAIMFKSELPRMFWKQHGHLRRVVTRNKGTGDFSLIISDEYEKAVRIGPPERHYKSLRAAGTRRKNSDVKWDRFAASGLGVAALAALIVAARKSTHGRKRGSGGRHGMAP
ncbi:hypothetical protein Asp14428_65430 [Actinoplanes sp. NBRC 14428]|nr:hypothetical protein Asp14428_65430 [Actinoplanes sp. NBRC 14428]